MNISDTVKRKDKIISSDLEKETVMLDIDQGKYFGLDVIGARIWQLIEQPTQISAIIATILDEYDVDPKVCENDVTDFLNQMIDLQLIEKTE